MVWSAVYEAWWVECEAGWRVCEAGWEVCEVVLEVDFQPSVRIPGPQPDLPRSKNKGTNSRVNLNDEEFVPSKSYRHIFRHVH